ncbi:MAG: VWA domain-containing protein [Nocardioidaceae bacterium]|nr:VWA domain-containing protein [Nocardioidaceae bacterium]
MNFLEPQRLWSLFIVVGLVAVYVLLQLRKSEYTVRFTNLALLDSVAPRRVNWRQHVAVSLALLTLAFAIALFAQPSKVDRVPIEVTAEVTVVLTVDVSLSMQAADVEPNRFTLAKSTAVGFLDELPSNFKVALVSFSGTATLEVAPTQNRSKVDAAIGGLELAERTATGEGIYSALEVIEQEQAQFSGEGVAAKAPAFIVLISDGHRTVGRSQVLAAEAAAAAQVPIFTVALGTPMGVIESQGERVAVPVEIDELKEIADISGGRAYVASTPDDLLDAYESVDMQLEYREQEVDATSDYVPYLLLLCLASTVAGLFVASRWP